MATNFDRITASTATLATFLASLPPMRGPWDAAFDAAICSTCAVQDCNAEGCPHQRIRENVILWWLRLSQDADDTPRVITLENVEEFQTWGPLRAMREAAESLETILERAIPKAPTKDSLADRGCPSCGEYISWDALNDPLEYAPSFCKHCGQALDWSREVAT